MDRPCKTCGFKDPARGRRARYCSKCVLEKPCAIARGEGNRTPQHVLDYRMGLKQRLAELNKRGPETTEKAEVIN